jgi:hypothetical protein
MPRHTATARYKLHDVLNVSSTILPLLRQVPRKQHVDSSCLSVVDIGAHLEQSLNLAKATTVGSQQLTSVGNINVLCISSFVLSVEHATFSVNDRAILTSVLIMENDVRRERHC